MCRRVLRAKIDFGGHDFGVRVGIHAIQAEFVSITKTEGTTTLREEYFQTEKNYTFNAPFSRYLPPLLSPSSWKLRRQLSKGLNHDYFTYTGDKAERLMLKVYGLHPRIGSRKEISASSVKTKLFNAAKGKNSTWEEYVLPEVAKIIKENWDVVEKFAKIKDETKRVAVMKFPRDGYWSK